MYILHHFPASQHGRRVVSLLEEAKLPYEVRHVAMDEGAHQAPEYAALNPNRQVPTLQSETLTLHESNAILRYLCNRHGLDDWYPPAPEDRARVDQWLDWNQCRLSPSVVDVVLNRVFMGPAGDAAAIERGLSLLPQHFEVLDGQLQQQSFVATERPTIADLSIASNIFHLGLASATPTQPAIKAWYERMERLPGFQASIAGLA